MPKKKDAFEERLGKTGAEKYRPGKKMTKLKALTQGRKPRKTGTTTRRKSK